MAVRLAAFELQPRGIIAFAVHPGWVRTDMGGATAPLSVTESVGAMLTLLDTLGPGDAGRLLDRNGTGLPW